MTDFLTIQRIASVNRNLLELEKVHKTRNTYNIHSLKGGNDRVSLGYIL
jgi:hypothetical protein